MAAILDPSRRAAEILLEAVNERLGADSMLTGHHLADWKETGAGVRARFIDKDSGKTLGEHDGALLIAADGIHSAIRAQLSSERRPADLERPHPVARRHRRRAVSDRPHHDHGRLPDR